MRGFFPGPRGHDLSQKRGLTTELPRRPPQCTLNVTSAGASSCGSSALMCDRHAEIFFLQMRPLLCVCRRSWASEGGADPGQDSAPVPGSLHHSSRSLSEASSPRGTPDTITTVSSAQFYGKFNTNFPTYTHQRVQVRTERTEGPTPSLNSGVQARGQARDTAGLWRRAGAPHATNTSHKDQRERTCPFLL